MELKLFFMHSLHVYAGTLSLCINATSYMLVYTHIGNRTALTYSVVLWKRKTNRLIAI